MTRQALVLSVLLAAPALAACEEPPPPPTFPITVSATSDPGEPLANVAVTANGTPIGQTGADGTLHVELSGPEGSPVQIGATCPEGHRQPTQLPTLSLRRVLALDPSAAARGIQVSIACPPTQRHAVLVVRAGGTGLRAGIPVMIDGREVARTDTSGTAHVAVDNVPGSTFQVMLATATATPLLRPQDPRMTFTFPDADEIFVFDQPFDELPPERPRVRRRREPEAQPVITGPRLPVRIGGRQ